MASRWPTGSSSRRPSPGSSSASRPRRRTLRAESRWARPGTPRLQEVAAGALADSAAAPLLARRAPGPLAERTVLDLATAAKSHKSDAIENALADYELRIQRRLDRTRMLVRAGPAV